MGKWLGPAESCRRDSSSCLHCHKKMDQGSVFSGTGTDRVNKDKLGVAEGYIVADMTENPTPLRTRRV